MNEVFTEVLVKGSADRLEIILAKVSYALNIEGVEEEEGQLKFYFKQESFDENVIKLLIEENNVEYYISEVYNKNWNEIWETDFQPVVVGNFATIRAGFHPPDTTVTYEIIITPKMSFGTGHHATTHMMIRMMEAFDPCGKTVIDFGTGTGVLAILAAKMKASHVSAIDCDPWSIANATENFETNSTPGIALTQSDHFPTGMPPVDLVLANINRNVIIDNLAAVAQGVKPGGLFIISGVLTTDVPDIQNLMQKSGFSELKALAENNWAALAFVKN